MNNENRDKVFDRGRGTLCAGSVWGYVDGDYKELEELHALIGCWVYVNEPTVVLVYGLPPTNSSIALAPGWNLIGASREMNVPNLAAIVGKVWRWNANTQSYSATSVILPGFAHWIFATEQAIIDPDR